MTTIALPQEVLDAQAELEAIRAEYQAVHARLMPIGKKYRNLFEKFALDTFESCENKLAHILSPQFYDAGSAHLQASDKFMWDTYGTHCSGHNALTNQRLPQLTFKTGDDAHNAKIRRLIEDALPHMIPFSADMTYYTGKVVDSAIVGFCLFGILEHTLAQHASVNVYVSHDKKIMVSYTRYSGTKYTDVMEFEEGLDYLLKNHYYESTESSDED